MFGKNAIPKSGKPFEFVSTSSSQYYAWNGNVFDNDIVRSCVRPIANAIGKLSVKHIRGISVNQTPWINSILEKPNPFMSMQDLLTKLIYQREINHNAFAYIKRDDLGYPIEIYPVPYTSVKLLEVGQEVFAEFDFWFSKKMTVNYTDLIHLRKDYFSDDFYGASGYNCLKNIMEIISTTDQGIVNAVKNSAIIKWILKFKGVLKPEDKALQIAEFVKNYMSISNTGGAAASDPRYDLEQVKESNYIPTLEQTKETIQRLYSYFGVNENIVQNKYSEDEYNAFYESVLEPIIIQLSNAFTNAFFTAREKSFGNKIIFDTNSLAYASMQTKLGLVALVDRGMMTPNEVREIMNLPHIEGGNVPLRRLDTVPITEIGGDTIGNEEGTTDSGTESSLESDTE